MHNKNILEVLRHKVTFEFIPHLEEADFVGNCSAVDPDTDASTEAWIRNELDNGNQAAWFCAECRGTYRGITESDWLGCCSYKSYSDFIEEKDGYWNDMQNAVLLLIAHKLESMARIYEETCKAAELLE